MASSQAIVFNKDYTKVLLVLRRDMPLWVLPGGRIDPGETPEEAAIRETFEESGYHIIIKRKTGEHFLKRKQSCVSLFEGEIIGGEATNSNETKDVKFFELSNLPLNFSPYGRVYIEDALKFEKTFEPKFDFEIPLHRYLMIFSRHPFGFIRFLLVKAGIHIDI